MVGLVRVERFGSAVGFDVVESQNGCFLIEGMKYREEF
jgi:hypothetical protein